MHEIRKSFLLFECFFDCNRHGDGSADHGREMRSISDGNKSSPPVAGCLFTHGMGI